MRFDGLQADEEAVAEIYENAATLLTADEREKLEVCARRIAELNGTVFEIVVEAAARGRATPQDVMNAREAFMRYAASLTMEYTILSFSEVVTIN